MEHAVGEGRLVLELVPLRQDEMAEIIARLRALLGAGATSSSTVDNV